MGRFDGEGTFKALNRAMFAAGTPSDVFASAALRNQEYWLARQPQTVGTPPPRGERDHYASYDWRVLWHTWIDMREGVSRVVYRHALETNYDGANDTPPLLEARLTVHGVGEHTVEIAAYTDAIAEFIVERDGDTAERGLGEVLVTFEFRSNAADIEKLISDYPGVNTDPDADETLAQWDTQGRLLFRRIPGGAETTPLPVNASHVFVTLERDENGNLEAGRVIEVHGPNRASLAERYTYHTCKRGEGEQVRLGRAHLTWFKWNGGELQLDHLPVGSSRTFISYRLSRMAPRAALQGKDVSIHPHNCTGMYARNPTLRLFGLPGARSGSGEIVRETRWTALRVLEQGVGVQGELTQVFDVNRHTPRLHVRYTRTAFFLQSQHPRITQVTSLGQVMNVTLTATQHRPGATSPVELGSVSRLERLDFLNPESSDVDELVHGFKRQFGVDLPGTTGVREHGQWRGGLGDLNDLLRAGGASSMVIDLEDHDPNHPITLTLAYSFEDVPNLTPLGDAYVLITSRSVYAQGLPFVEGAPSSAPKRIARQYAGHTALDTGLGRGVDSEDWSAWPDLNHLTWSQCGWTGEGIAGPITVTNDNFHQPDDLARWFMLCNVNRELPGGTWRVRLAAFVREVELRITTTNLVNSSSSTTVMTPSGTPPQWITHEFTFTDDAMRRFTLEMRTTGSDGVLYCFGPRESQAKEGDL